MEVENKKFEFWTKLDDFFEMYNLIQTVGDIDTNDEYFFNNEEINSIIAMDLDED